MLCDSCHKNEATIHIQEIVGSQKKTLHLCNVCAAEKQQLGNLNFGAFNLAEMLYELSGKKTADDGGNGGDGGENAADPGEAVAPVPAEPVCPRCQWTAELLRKTGRLGCAECYTTFSELLSEALKNMHRGRVHLGKHPGGNSAAAVRRQPRLQELAKLQKELKTAIATEEYEQAAELRDRIGALKEQLDADATGEATEKGGEA